MRVTLQDGRIVRTFLLDVEEANCHLIYDPISRNALLFDVGRFTDQMRDFMQTEKLALGAIVITHTHYDHAGGLGQAVSELDVPVYVHSAGLSALAPVRAQGLSDGQCVSEGGFEIIALATEGHTQDSMCYAVGDALFTGDTLFNGSVGGTGNTDLFLQETGNIRRKILTLPDHVTVFPGHGPITTVSIERTFNPFL